MSKVIYSLPFPLTWVKWMGDDTFPIVLPIGNFGGKGGKKNAI
jgi:hypothetical protein